MGFIQIINRKKITIISFFLFFYIILNLLDGERGLISYYEKQNINKQLLEEKNFLTKQLNIVEKKVEEKRFLEEDQRVEKDYPHKFND